MHLKNAWKVLENLEDPWCKKREFDGFLIIIVDNLWSTLRTDSELWLTASHPSRLASLSITAPLRHLPTSPVPPLLSTQSVPMSYFKRPFTLSYLSAHPWRSEAGWHQRLAGWGRHIYLAVTACGKRDCWRLRGSSKKRWPCVKESVFFVSCIRYQPSVQISAREAHFVTRHVVARITFT